MDFLKKLGIKEKNYGSSTGTVWNKTTSEPELKIHSPVDGKFIASVYQASVEDYESVMIKASEAFIFWRNMPAPKRGEIVRLIGNKLRDYKNDLGKLVSYEMGKSLQEGLGEVQEMIDICDFAVGQSRQLYGFTMHSERPKHRMYDSTILLVLSLLSQPSISRLLFGLGMLCLLLFVVMSIFGNPLQKLH